MHLVLMASCMTLLTARDEERRSNTWLVWTRIYTQHQQVTLPLSKGGGSVDCILTTPFDEQSGKLLGLWASWSPFSSVSFPHKQHHTTDLVVTYTVGLENCMHG